MPKIIRLLAPVTTEGRQLEAGVVVPATNDAANLLLKHQPPLAELTDATERHPSIRLLHTVTIDPPKNKAEAPAPAPKDKA